MRCGDRVIGFGKGDDARGLSQGPRIIPYEIEKAY